jgi:small subunit ribosomal protein S4
VGQEISVRPKSREMDVVKASVDSPVLRIPSFLSFDGKTFTGKLEALPTREDVPIEIEEQLVVEYYSPRL